MRFLFTILAVVLVSQTAIAQTVTAGVVYGLDNRPIEVNNLSIGSDLFDVTISYDIDAHLNPQFVGGLPDHRINLGATQLRRALDDANVDSPMTIIYFQPNDDPLDFGQFEVLGLVNTNPGMTDWHSSNANFNANGAGSKKEFIGFARFTDITAVPEPGAFALLGAVALLGVGWSVHKRQLRKRA